jgi:hypothetical protein
VLTQDKYTTDLLRKAGMTNCKGAATLLAANERLSASVGTPLGQMDTTQYRSVVRAAQYLTLTRLDIAFSVNKVC